MRRPALTLLLAAAAAHAGVIGYVSNGSSLFTIDVSNASVLATHTLSQGGLRGLALSPQGVLYGAFNISGQIGTIDPSTGSVTILASNPGAFIHGMTFNSAGNLYILDNLNIDSVNPITGLLIGAVGCSGGGQGIAIGPDAKAWLTIGVGLTQDALTGVGGGCTGTGSTGSGNLLIGIYNLSSTFYAVLSHSSGAPSLVTFDGTTFNSSPTLNTIGALPSGTNFIVVQTDFAPEPAALWLLGLGMSGMLLYRRFR